LSGEVMPWLLQTIREERNRQHAVQGAQRTCQKVLGKNQIGHCSHLLSISIGKSCVVVASWSWRTVLNIVVVYFGLTINQSTFGYA
jgi:hypothetical protein